jgi:hypothetical protein
MKIALLLVCSAITLGALAGCKAFSGQSPPSGVEGQFFEVQTNWVEKVTYHTNTVLVTNAVPVNVTNEVGQVVVVTNEVILPKYELMTVTNFLETYQFTTSTNATASVSELGGIINTYAPGVGTLGGGIVIGLLALWGRLRSYKKTGTVLAQNIESIREFVKTLPDGDKYDQAIVEFIQDNQREAGTLDAVVRLLERYVSHPQAVASVAEIKALLESLKK